MIAIIGKVASGKSTLLNKLKHRGFKIFNCDKFFIEEYKKNGFFYNEINNKIGSFLNDENGISKQKIKEWISQNPNSLDVLEKCTYPVLFQYLKINSFDFVEIPKLISKNFDFSSLFSGIICLENSASKFLQNYIKRSVDNFLKNKISEKNDPFYIKNLLFNKIPIVDIYEYNPENDKIIDVFLQLLNVNV
ncbi:dephospho-CoA kinase [Mycoplasmopsis felifaucium]|uniref:dephospho-CoA kinase n=1 Tax=Mycoplasmopsis felifaucium TaxID=35768 RepID=UPI000480FBB9|nr:dephospho-CoA kinase [Mycoplasmopsis felifaucium]